MVPLPADRKQSNTKPLPMVLANRIRMNSASLQKAFPVVYKEFFSKCSTVVSAPGSFFWSAGLAVLYGGTGIIQKIPQRVYVGIEQDGSPDLKYGDYVAYAPHQQQFETFFHDRNFEIKFIKLLNQLRHTLPKQISGKLYVLSEVPRGAGLNQSGAINISIASLLALETGLATPAKLTQLAATKTPDIMADATFQKILRFAWKLESCSHDEVGSASAPFAAFIESTTPMIFFSERRSGSYRHHPYSRMPSDIEGHHEIFDGIAWNGYRLKDLWHWQNDLTWPIDYGLFYLGQQKHSGVYLKPMRIVKENLMELEKFVAGDLKKFYHAPDEAIPAFIDLANTNHQYGYWEHCVDFLIILSVKAISDLKKLIENGTAESLDELCDTVALQEKVYEFFTKGLPSSGERDTLHHIKQVLRDKNNNGLRSIRVLPDRPDGGGDLLFIAPQGYLQDNLEQFQGSLRSHVSPLIRIDYASWIDGEESGGIGIEQDFRDNIFSPFVTHGTIGVKEWQANTAPIQRVYSQEAFEKKRKDIDLLLDPFEHKIYIQGKLLTSKKIKSAKGTIEILKILLNHLNEDVRASDLPPSAYVERNEMQSKIITPLCAVFKEIAGHKIPLHLQGGLRKNFSIKLEAPNFVIGLVEKQI
ncbi:MAG: hypothetical protein V1668_03535 [Patescibacteria group bacterium]